MGMPAANRRIKELIDETTGGKVLPFLNLINENREEKISHQRLNRLFSEDARTGSWPGVPHEIFEAILNRFPKIDAYWLVTGKKSGTIAVPDKNLVALSLRTDDAKALRINLGKLLQALEDVSGIDKEETRPDQQTSLGKKTRKEMGLGQKKVKGSLHGKGK